MALNSLGRGIVLVPPRKTALLAVQKNAQFAWVPYMGTVVKAAGPSTVIGTIILPVANEAEAEKIVASVKRSTDNAGNLSLSFEKGGKTSSYLFRKEADGLVLKQ